MSSVLVRDSASCSREPDPVMDLFYAPRSPFSRKIIAVAAELGLQRRIRLVLVDPWINENLRLHNPTCKVPTLLLENGSALFDSPVIARFLDSLAGGKLVPPGSPGWDALGREALGDALAEAVIRRFVETLNPQGEQVEKTVARQEAAIESVLDALERRSVWMKTPVDLGHFAVACAIEYLDGRSPELAWERERPLLAEWFHAFRSRPSMRVAAEPASGTFRIAD